MTDTRVPIARIVEVADRAAIHDLVVAYAKARDTTDPELYTEIFAEDAAIRASGGGVLSADRERILAKVANDRLRFNPGTLDPKHDPGEQSYGVMRHLVSNVSVELDGDAARSDYYVTTLAYNKDARRPEVIAVTRNVDDYARRDGRWWIVRSTLHFGWEHEEMGKALRIGPYTPPEYRS